MAYKERRMLGGRTGIWGDGGQGLSALAHGGLDSAVWALLGVAPSLPLSLLAAAFTVEPHSGVGRTTGNRRVILQER